MWTALLVAPFFALDLFFFGANILRVSEGGWVPLAIAFELFTLWAIRDNLTLNVLMLVAPVQAIKAWQGGA